MKITYIYHSGFMAELATCTLLFDYWKGDLPQIRKDLPLYVFSSHVHHDHFAQEIFSLRNKVERAHFLLSFDIKDAVPKEDRQGDIIYLEPDETFGDDLIEVRTLKSTDEGVAFVCKALAGGIDGKIGQGLEEPVNIYYAGDLNNWYWDEDYTHQPRNYHHELEKIRGQHFDLAFVPLDPRLEDRFYLGVDDFMHYCDTDHLFPMHMWDKYQVINQLKKLPESQPYRDRVETITAPGQTFEI